MSVERKHAARKRLAAWGHAVSEVPEWLLGRVRPFAPYDFLKAQPPPLEDLLPYVSWVEDDGRALFLFHDGGIGVGWELAPVGHEMLSDDELTRVTTAVAGLFSKVSDARVSFQVLFDSKPARSFKQPHYAGDPRTGAQKIQVDRIRFLGSLAETPLHRIRLMDRRVFLTLRIENAKHPYSLSDEAAGATAGELAASVALIAGLAQQAQAYVTDVEYTLAHAGIGFAPLSPQGLLRLLRETFHDLRQMPVDANLSACTPRQDQSLASQVARGFVDFTPSTIGAGSDTWEVCSWVDQPPLVHAGLFSHLLTLDVPCRAVVNIRPCPSTVDLERMRALLRNADDAYGEMQRDEVRATQDSVARGDVLSFVSVHLLVRNEGRNSLATRQAGVARGVVSRLKTATQIPWVIETHAAPAIFLLALPFGYTRMAAGFSGRERRVLSSNLGPFLPLFGTFEGTRTPVQYMVSRAGGLVTLDPRDSETSPHTAILGSSGSGKSFFMANKALAFVASAPRSMVFAIDKKTSYKVLARVVGEDTGFQFVEPPKSYPNIFRGKFDAFRLPVLVGILRTAISLVSADAKIGAIEEMLLSEAVTLAFEQNELDARTEYTDGALRERTVGRVRIPRLSDVVENLFPVALKAKIPQIQAEALRTLLSPFLGSGPYAALFDREEFEDFDPPTPGFSLYDLDALSGNEILTTIVTQCILAEILRQIRRPENAGVPGMLIIEEVGVLAGESPELVAFVRDAWKRFRKMNIECIGLTNQVKDYLELPGPREIWAVSPNKIVLRLLEEDLAIARVAFQEGKGSLFSSEYHFEVVGSLRKLDGAYADAFWLGDEVKGTFTFFPSGFDYWCAASTSEEVKTVDRLTDALGSTYAAVQALAKRFPGGVRDDRGKLRPLAEDEWTELLESGRAA